MAKRIICALILKQNTCEKCKHFKWKTFYFIISERKLKLDLIKDTNAKTDEFGEHKKIFYAVNKPKENYKKVKREVTH